jgi:hypothetical protein
LVGRGGKCRADEYYGYQKNEKKHDSSERLVKTRGVWKERGGDTESRDVKVGRKWDDPMTIH